jgi:SAM-dependent methyltransferase
MPTSRFDDLSDVYEAMIDWPKRLAAEEAFFRPLFEQVDARRVADLACGTGHQAAMFHSWGLTVDAADLSPRMIQQARNSFGSPDGLTWTERGFDQPLPADLPYDVVTCLGNSLALAGDLARVEQAVAAMLGPVRPGGLLVLHLLNAQRLPDGPCVWQKCLRRQLPQGESLITKGVQRVGDRAFVQLVVAPLDAPDQFHAESVPFLPLTPTQIEHFALAAGAHTVTFCGNHRRDPFEPGTSPDLIAVCKK